MSSAATLPNNWNLDSSRLLFFPETKRESENSSGLDQELLRGRLTELSGAQHSAQMSLVAHWIRQVQEQGQVAAWSTVRPACSTLPIWPMLASTSIDSWSSMSPLLTPSRGRAICYCALERSACSSSTCVNSVLPTGAGQTAS